MSRRFDFYGPIGFGGTELGEFVAWLKAGLPGDSLELHINSPGGDAFTGIGIFNVLADYRGRKEIVVDGVAASAAGLIVMAGDRIRIPRNGLFMLHLPVTSMAGGADELRKGASMLESVAAAAVEIYAKRSRRSAAEITAMMVAETWLTGQQAVEQGFADVTERDAQMRGTPAPKSAASLYKNAPASFYALLGDRYSGMPIAAARNIVSDVQAHVSDTVQAAEENVPYLAEYAANPHLAARMPIEDYIATRRIDDGLDRLGL